MVMRLEVGNEIKWVSAAGVLTGTVKNIVLDLNAAEQTIPWMTITDVENNFGKKLSNVYMCANDNHLKMMKVQVL
jgi:hypothetical protein